MDQSQASAPGDADAARTTALTTARPTIRDADAVRPLIVGTIAWAIAGLILLLRLDDLRANDREWWLAVCAIGFGLGLIGTWVVVRRRRAYRAAGHDAG